MRSMFLFFAASMLCPTARALAQGGDATHTRADSCAGPTGPDERGGMPPSTTCTCAVNPRDSSVARLQRASHIACSARAGDADRSAGAARARQRGPGRPPLVASAAMATRTSWHSSRRSSVRRARSTVPSYYHGQPRVGAQAPWDGGFVWARTASARRGSPPPNEGLGASVWWPQQGLSQADEPDSQRDRDHRSRLDDRSLERPLARHHAQHRRHHDVRMVRLASRSTTTTWR